MSEEGEVTVVNSDKFVIEFFVQDNNIKYTIYDGEVLATNTTKNEHFLKQGVFINSKGIPSPDGTFTDALSEVLPSDSNFLTIYEGYLKHTGIKGVSRAAASTIYNKLSPIGNFFTGRHAKIASTQQNDSPAPAPKK